jgi:hypothetical protein
VAASAVPHEGCVVYVVVSEVEDSVAAMGDMVAPAGTFLIKISMPTTPVLINRLQLAQVAVA